MDVVEDDRQFQRHRDSLVRVLQKIGTLVGETGTALDAASSETPATSGRKLERLRKELLRLAQEYVEESTAFSDYTQERARKIEETKRVATMADQRSRPERDTARIQELSDELTTKLRLDRIDAAIKELLDFLSDEEFFSANASTGRRRRLRALQNAIEKSLQK